MSLKRSGLEILEVKSGVETFIEVIGTVVDDNTIAFRTCVDMGSNVDMYLYAWSTQHDYRSHDDSDLKLVDEVIKTSFDGRFDATVWCH